MSEENLYTFENEEYRRTYWHTCSHVLAQAMKRLHPEVKLAIGPSIDNGFYYDFDTPEPFTEGQLEELEAEMRKICKEKLKLERFELPRQEAIAFMEEKGEPYKVELINDLPEDAVISFYRQGEFTDLCAGPHVDSTGRIKGNAIKLTACNAAYWRGDSSRQTLQRIYGVAFPKKDELDEYLQRIEEAKKRDHRKLGKELGLFMMAEEGPGFPFFLPKGMVLKNTLLEYWRECHKRYGYVEIATPVILNQHLWHQSGHWDHYKDNMYTTVIDGEDYAVKPMNCPGGMLVEDNRRGDLHIAVPLVALTPVVQEGILQHHALGQEEGEARALLAHHKEAQLLAQLPVVPLLGLLNPGQVLVQLLLPGEGHAVDPLEGLAAGVAPPVGGVAGGELDGVALDPPGGVHVGAGAEVHELPLLVEGDHRVLGQVVDELHLVGLALLLHVGDGLLAGQLKALQLQLLLADFPHFHLQLLHLGLSEGLGGVEVVVEAVVDGGADGQLYLRVQALHGLGQDVGAGVPIGLAVGFVFKGIQVFLAHVEELLSEMGAKKLHPCLMSGVKCKTPRFHPAYGALRAVARDRCNGRRTSRSSRAAREWWPLPAASAGISQQNDPLSGRRIRRLLRHR